MSRRPLPAAIYWRRRFLLLAALLLLTWTVVTLWPSGEGSRAATPEPTPSASAATPSSTPAAEQGQAEDTTVSIAAGGPPCDLTSVRMEAHVPPDQVTEEKVRIQLALSTTSEEPCTFRAEPGDVVAIVSSGGNAVWDSDVCGSTRLVDGAVALSPGWSTVADATWSGRGSGPACSKEEGWAAPGEYGLRIGTLGGEPGSTTFRLTEKSAEQKAAEKRAADEKKAVEEAERQKAADEAAAAEEDDESAPEETPAEDS